MRKIIQIIISISLLAVACNDEEFLNREPHSLTDRAFYTTPSGALQGLNAAYDILQAGESVERVEFAGTVCSGDAMAGGEPGGNDQSHMQNMMRFQNDPLNNYVLTYWQSMYRGIYRCNLILDYLGKPDELGEGFTEELRTRIMGEATFLRGLYHFKLQINYGGYSEDFNEQFFDGQMLGVPFIEHVLPPEEWQQERPPLDSTWSKIERDFINASDMLPEKSEYLAEDVGRATRGAALSMLAKTYLYQGKWQQAYDIAKEVIESGEYWLEGDNDHSGSYTVTRLTKDGEVDVDMVGYKWIWQPEANNCGESIFDVQHFQQGSLRYPEGQEGNLVPRYYGPRGVWAYNTVGELVSTEYFWGFILPTDYFVNTAYADVGCEVGGEIVDPRFKLSVVDIGDSLPYYYQDPAMRAMYSDSVMYSSWHNWPTPGRCTWKYFTDPIYSTQITTLGDYPQNTKYFRFADLLLMGAEAAVHVGQNADALEWINWVRTRARNAGNTSYPEDYTGTITLEQVYAERRVELAFEGHQFYDLVRTGRAEQVLKIDAMEYPTATNPNNDATAPQQFGNNFQVGQHEIWPIPEQEIVNSEGVITQNPYY